MTTQHPEETTIERIQDRAHIVGVLAAQLEAMARAMTHVNPTSDEGPQPIEVADLPKIMALVARECRSIVDLAGDIEATAEFAMSGPLTVVNGREPKA